MSVIDIEQHLGFPDRYPIFHLVFLMFAVVPPLFYVHQPLLHDEMIYLVIGREIASGGTLYAGITDHKTPGIYLLAAWLWTTVPEPYLGGRLLVYTAHAVTAVLLFRIGCGFRRLVGAVASLVFLLAVYSPVFDGYILMTEPFAVLLGTGATLLLFSDPETLPGERGTHDFAAGVLLALAVLFNQTVLLFGPVIVLWSAARLVSAADETGLRGVLSRYVSIGAGFLIPLALAGVYALSQGALEEMLYYTIVLPANYYETPYFLQRQFLSAASALPVWLLAVGTAFSIGRSVLSGDAFDHRLVFLCLWLIVVAIPGLTSFHGGHRYIFVMPPAALLAAIGLSRIVESLGTDPLTLRPRHWIVLSAASAVSVVVFLGASGFDSQYVLLVAAGLGVALVGAAVVTFLLVWSSVPPSWLTNRQWAGLVARVFVVLLIVGGTAGVNGQYLFLQSDGSIETQAADAEELGAHVDGRFYVLGPPTRYELAYFTGASPARTFIAAPYGEPLAAEVIRTLERDEVEYVLVKSEQVDDGRIDSDYTYYSDPRRQISDYVEANYEPTETTDDFVIYRRQTAG